MVSKVNEKILAIALGCKLRVTTMQNAYVECFAPEKKKEEKKNFFRKLREALTPFSVRLRRTIKETHRYLEIVDQSFDIVVVSNHIRECNNCFEIMKRKAREYRDSDQSYYFWEHGMKDPELRSPSEEEKERFYQKTLKEIEYLPRRIETFLEEVKR